MRLRELAEDGIDVLALQGEIDLHYAPVLRSLLQSKIKGRCPALILDLSEVAYIDSTGLGTIIEYFRDAAAYAGVLCLAGLSESVKGIFQIVQLHKTIPIFATKDEAKNAIKQGRVMPPEDSFFNRPPA
jgi:anti-anti-sigma factor